MKVKTKIRIMISILVVIVLSIIISMVVVIKTVINRTEQDIPKYSIEETKETKKQYDYNKPIEELHLGSLDNYVDYLIELSKQIKPVELQKLLVIDRNRAVVYRDSYFGRQENGKQIFLELYDATFRELLNRVIGVNKDWDGLPLTEHFIEKYKDKVISKNPRVHSLKLDEKRFDIHYDITKYEGKDRGDVVHYYRDIYNFKLDEDGYLDDIEFEKTEEIKEEEY